MKSEIIKDIVVWDIVNWSNAIKYWGDNAQIMNKNYECLELGSSKGGLSLWLALIGNNVLCTDLNGPEDDAYRLHEKYECTSKNMNVPPELRMPPWMLPIFRMKIILM
jgi:hypothetical protein